MQLKVKVVVKNCAQVVKLYFLESVVLILLTIIPIEHLSPRLQACLYFPEFPKIEWEAGFSYQTPVRGTGSQFGCRKQTPSLLSKWGFSCLFLLIKLIFRAQSGDCKPFLITMLL